MINKWTLEKLCPGLVGSELSLQSTIILSFLNLYCLIAGTKILRQNKFPPLKEFFPIILLLITFFPQYLFLWFFLDHFTNMPDMLNAEMLNILFYGIVILCLPRYGILLSFLLQNLLCIVQCFYVYNYGYLPTESFFFVLFETNFSEAIGYVTDYIFSPLIVIFLASYSVAFWVLWRVVRKADKKILRQYVVLLLVPLFVLLMLKDVRQNISENNIFCKFVTNYHKYLEVQQQSRDAILLSMQQMEDINFSISRPDKEVHILIIGESADRDHMSIYDYGRETTPSLEGIGEQLYAFRDVISPSEITIPSMKALLTLDNYESRDDSVNNGFLIQYLRKAGYKTYWISNQNPIGIHDTLTTIMAKSCDQTDFFNISKNFGNTSYDQILLAPLKKVLSEDVERQYIFIHLMGQHFPYQHRYPQEYDVFRDDIPGKTTRQAKFINSYDNAIIYNDYIVSEIIKMVRDKEIYASVLFLSDHGQEVYDRSDFHGHSFLGGLEVPFILWLSEEYKSHQPQKTKQLAKYLDRKYMMDDTIYSIFDLLSITFASFEPERSIFSPDFQPRKRIITTPDRRQSWDHDADVNTPEAVDRWNKRNKKF